MLSGAPLSMCAILTATKLRFFLQTPNIKTAFDNDWAKMQVASCISAHHTRPITLLIHIKHELIFLFSTDQNTSLKHTFSILILQSAVCKTAVKRLKTCSITYFSSIIFGGFAEKLYFCTVFFMVLDLRLSKDCGCRDDNPSFFCIYGSPSHTS